MSEEKNWKKTAAVVTGVTLLVTGGILGVVGWKMGWVSSSTSKTDVEDISKKELGNFTVPEVDAKGEIKNGEIEDDDALLVDDPKGENMKKEYQEEGVGGKDMETSDGRKFKVDGVAAVKVPKKKIIIVPNNSPPSPNPPTKPEVIKSTTPSPLVAKKKEPEITEKKKTKPDSNSAKPGDLSDKSSSSAGSAVTVDPAEESTGEVKKVESAPTPKAEEFEAKDVGRKKVVEGKTTSKTFSTSKIPTAKKKATIVTPAPASTKSEELKKFIMTLDKFKGFMEKLIEREWITYTQDEINTMKANLDKIDDAKVKNPIFPSSFTPVSKDNLISKINNWEMRDKAIKVLEKPTLTKEDKDFLMTVVARGSVNYWAIRKKDGSGKLSEEDILYMILPPKIQKVIKERNSLQRAVLDLPEAPDMLKELELKHMELFELVKGMHECVASMLKVSNGSLKDDLEWWYRGTCSLNITRDPNDFEKNLKVLRVMNPERYKDVNASNFPNLKIN